MKPPSPMGWLMRQARPARPALLLAAGAGAAQGPLVVAQALLLAHMVDALVMRDALVSDLAWAFAALLGVFVARAALVAGQEAAGFAASSAVRGRLRAALTEHLMTLGPAWAAQGESGARVSLLLEQVEATDGFFARFLPQSAAALAVPAVILIAVFPLDWLAGLILALTAPLIPLFMILIGLGAKAAQARHMVALERLGAHFLDRLKGLETLRLLGQAAVETERVRAAADDYRRKVMAVLRIAFLSSAVLEFFSSVAIAMVAVYVGLSLLGVLPFTVRAEPLSLFAGLAVLLMAPDFFAPLRQLAAAYHDRAAAVAVAETVLALPPPPIPTPTSGGAVGLVLDEVRVRYPGVPDPVLDGFSLHVRPGEWVGLSGPSGAGKTTVLRVLLGFLEAEAGRVLRPARAAWVGQNTHLFHGTIADNVRLGHPGASNADVATALKRAGLAEVVAALPHGVDTLLGEGGLGLSGGQAQRLAVARAWLADAPVLLLDEPTASLDPATAERLLESLAELARGRAVLMASHDPTALARCGRVVRLAGEDVAEEGLANA